MNDYFLKFESVEQAQPVLYTDDGALRYINTDIIGDIYKDDVLLPGYHVNIRTVADAPVDELTPFLVYPANPVRIWF